MALDDHVLRLNEFRKRWPVVEIRAPRSVNGRWVAEWPLENGSDMVTRYNLGMLLDELEARFDRREPSWKRELPGGTKS